MLLVTVPAVNWSTFCWLERNFSLLTTVRTDDFVHCSETTIRPTTHRPSTPPIIRDTLPVPLLGYRPSESEQRAEIVLLISARQTSSRGRHAFSVPPQPWHDSSLWQDQAGSFHPWSSQWGQLRSQGGSLQVRRFKDIELGFLGGYCLRDIPLSVVEREEYD